MDGSWYKPKLETPYNFISLGAGVQSSTMALMAARGEITPMPNAAIFADTQSEPESVYKWLRWLKVELEKSFPVYVVSRGDLTAESLEIRKRKRGEGSWAKSLIPAYVMNSDGTKGIMGRQCTWSYKLEELERMVKKLAHIKRKQDGVIVTQWIGISADETRRMKPARVEWAQNRWPLIELGMKRSDRLAWMERNNYPTPPRSACVYCPFHSDAEWRRLQREEPEEFAKAVKFEKDLQAVKAKTYNMNGITFLHASLKPLDSIDFSSAEERGQANFLHDLHADANSANCIPMSCEGMCGV